MRTIIATTVALLTMLNIAAFAQQKGTLTDTRDKKKYKTVKIGEQTWMAENLNYLDKADKISKCYGNKPANCTKYGRLYNWETAMKSCPKGWHLPSNGEWDALDKTVGGSSTAGTKLKVKKGWNDFNGKSGNGTDDYGFSALPGGKVDSNGDFSYVGYDGSWWSNSEGEGNSNNAYIRNMTESYDNVGSYDEDKSYLLSVRCVQD
jgi:uncharacterized protein (TIGR02145 family)